MSHDVSLVVGYKPSMSIETKTNSLYTVRGYLQGVLVQAATRSITKNKEIALFLGSIAKNRVRQKCDRPIFGDRVKKLPFNC